MAESSAQRAARERNLRKGNPAAYKGGSKGEAQENGGPPPEDEGSEGGGGGTRTFRARISPAKPKSKSRARKPAARRTPPRAPADPPPAKRGSSGGFFDGLLKGLGG